MSWKGFTKAVNRGATTILQSAGAIEKTIDKEYEEEERRFHLLESKAEKLQKEAKGYLDALRAMSLAQSRMAMTIDHFYDGSSPLSNAALQYKDAIELTDSEVRGSVDSDYRTTVLDPLSRFCEFFTPFNEAIRRRNKKMLDYDALRSKQRKLVDKPSEDSSRLPRAEQEVIAAKQTYDTVNIALAHEIPMLVDLRVPYLDPSFEALLKIQYTYCMHAAQHLDGLQKNMNGAGMYGNDPVAIEHSLEGVAEGILNTMRDLSICSNIITSGGAHAGTLSHPAALYPGPANPST